MPIHQINEENEEASAQSPTEAKLRMTQPQINKQTDSHFEDLDLSLDFTPLNLSKTKSAITKDLAASVEDRNE